MASPLCGTGIYANDVLCEVIGNLDNLILTAEASLLEAQTALATLKTSTETEVAAISAIDYDADTTGIGKTYVEPTAVADPGTAPTIGTVTPPTEPVLPTVAVPSVTAPTDPVAPGVTAPSDPSTPSALPTLPDPTVSGWISDAAIQAIFDKAADNLAQVSVKDERDAQYKYSSMGVGMLNAALQKRLDEAEQNTNERISAAALENAVQEGQWKREDAQAIYTLEVQKSGEETSRYGTEAQVFSTKYNADVQWNSAKYSNDVQWTSSKYGTDVQWNSNKYGTDVQWQSSKYGTQVQLFSNKYSTDVQLKTSQYSTDVDAYVNKYRADIDSFAAQVQSEGERRGWSEMQIRDVLEQADKATLYAIEKTKLVLDITRQTDEAIAQLNVGLTQAIYAAADYNLGGSGSQSISQVETKAV